MPSAVGWEVHRTSRWSVSTSLRVSSGVALLTGDNSVQSVLQQATKTCRAAGLSTPNVGLSIDRVDQDGLKHRQLEADLRVVELHLRTAGGAAAHSEGTAATGDTA